MGILYIAFDRWTNLHHPASCCLDGLSPPGERQICAPEMAAFQGFIRVSKSFSEEPGAVAPTKWLERPTQPCGAIGSGDTLLQIGQSNHSNSPSPKANLAE